MTLHPFRKLLPVGLFLACAGVLILDGRSLSAAASAPQLTLPPASISAQYLWIGTPTTDLATGEFHFGSFAFDSGLANQITPFVPVPIATHTVRAVKLFLNDRAGSYGGGVYMRCEVRDLHGNLLRMVSASDVDVEAAPELTWIDLPLSSNPADLVVGLGEYLAIHASPGGGAGGNLTVFSHVVAEVR